MKYELRVENPYEYDEDSSSGFGDHSVCWSPALIRFEAKTDKEAKKLVADYMANKRQLKFEGVIYRPRFMRLTMGRVVAYP